MHVRPTFFVRAPAGATLPSPRELERHLRRWIARELVGWLQLAVLERLEDNRVEWTSDAGVDPSCARMIAVRGVDIPGPRRPGLWAALSVARALAEWLGGRVLDPAARLRPPADGRVRAIHHVSVQRSRGLDGTRWLSSVGMAQFGLPELELLDVREAEVELATRLLLAAAQHMIEADRSREILVTIDDLQSALGGEADVVPSSTGRGWTRVALGLDGDGEGAWPELLRLGPPSGIRRWRDCGEWLRDAWQDLFGPALEAPQHPLCPGAERAVTTISDVHLSCMWAAQPGSRLA